MGAVDLGSNEHSWYISFPSPPPFFHDRPSSRIKLRGTGVAEREIAGYGTVRTAIEKAETAWCTSREEQWEERERGWPRFLGRRGQSEKTEMACSFRIICEPRRGLMSVFHDYRGNREACRRKAGRERERRQRGRRRRRGGKGSKLYFIWQRDCISQNKHRSGRASARKRRR